MNYITVRQAAQAWNISERRVQKYCTQGRLPGARKFGNAWQIPGSAPKPADGRTAAPGRTLVPRTGKPDGRAALLPLMNTAFAPGRCRAVLDAMPEGPNRDIATAEYLCFSGQAEAAARAAERYLHARSRETRLSANLLYAYANLSVGRIQQVRCALGEVQRTLTADRDPQRGAAALFVAATASVLLHLPLPDGMPPARRFLPLLPPGLDQPGNCRPPESFGQHGEAVSLQSHGKAGGDPPPGPETVYAAIKKPDTAPSSEGLCPVVWYGCGKKFTGKGGAPGCAVSSGTEFHCTAKECGPSDRPARHFPGWRPSPESPAPDS